MPGKSNLRKSQKRLAIENEQLPPVIKRDDCRERQRLITTDFSPFDFTIFSFDHAQLCCVSMSVRGPSEKHDEEREYKKL